MTARILLLLCGTVLLDAGILIGCQSHTPGPPPVSAAAQSTRNNCYSLLHQLLTEQKDVSILRFIKPEQADVKDLVKRIDTTSGAGAALLEEFARHDLSLRLDDFRLPPGETGTRDSIASTKEKELLTQSGDKFELTLLLTQTEALSYAWHLAKVAGENDLQPDRALAVAGIGKDMENYYRETFALLLAKIKLSPTNVAAMAPL